jgi:hypothetical protein
MTIQEYLESLLASQDLSTQQLEQLRSLRTRIEQELSLLSGSPRFYYAGSYGKGTMIKERFDLDIVIYWPEDCGFTIQGIFEAVGKQIKTKLWQNTHPKTVCWETNFEGGFHIDVVPGRALDKNYVEANLYRSDTGTSLKTSLKMHIDCVSKSGRRPAIRLMKLWRERQEVPFKKSFLLECITILACKGESIDNLGNQIFKTWQYIYDNIETLNIPDPANSNNSLSDDLTKIGRYMIKQSAMQAIQSVQAGNWATPFFRGLHRL